MVDMHNHRKRKSTFHINMLSQEYVSESTGNCQMIFTLLMFLCGKKHTNEIIEDVVLGD